jgi:DNA-binding transcriptional ArsR family regulator
MNEQPFSEWAENLKAMAHPTRLRILAELLNSPRCVSALHELLDVRQTGVSQHLSVLKHAGLVSVKQSGASHCYYLPRPGLVQAAFALLERDYPRLSGEEVQERIERALDERRRGAHTAAL